MLKFKQKIEITPWIAESHDSETGNRAFDSSLHTVEQQHELFDYIMPCLLEPTEEGGLRDNTKRTAELRMLADRYRLPWFPLVASPVPVAKKIISDRVLRRKHIDNLVNYANANHCKGLDIDYEFLPLEFRSLFTDFIAELHQALQREGRLLSIDLHPKVRPDDPWSIGAQAQDWLKLREHADIIHVMCYDQYHFAYTFNDPGPISTAPWTEAVLAYAGSVIPAEKLVIGLPTYAVDWNLTHPEKSINIFYNQVMERLRQFGGNQEFNSSLKQPCFRYRAPDGDEHEVWYEDAETLGRKLDVCTRYPLRGLAFWALTIEDPRIWDEVRLRLPDDKTISIKEN